MVVPDSTPPNPARVPETMNAIRKAIKGNNFAKCAVETALPPTMMVKRFVSRVKFLQE